MAGMAGASLRVTGGTDAARIDGDTERTLARREPRRESPRRGLRCCRDRERVRARRGSAKRGGVRAWAAEWLSCDPRTSSDSIKLSPTGTGTKAP